MKGNGRDENRLEPGSPTNQKKDASSELQTGAGSNEQHDVQKIIVADKPADVA